jgi:hypothetical protein
MVYESDSLPANPEIVAVEGQREAVASEVAKTLSATRAVMSPETMDTALYCVASLTMETHSASLEDIYDSLRECQGTASPGVGVHLAETCLSKTKSLYRPRMDSSDFDTIMTIAAPKIPDQDVVPVYRACWDMYRQRADSGGDTSRVHLGDCLIALGPRLPAEAAWLATQDALQRWPTETRQPYRRFLQQLYAALFDRVSEADRRTARRLAEQQGFTLQPEPSGSQRPPTAVKREVTFDDLADDKNRVRDLFPYLDTQRRLPIEERLALVRRLDEKGYLTTSSGKSHENSVMSWFIRDVPADASDSVVKMLAQPDCVGFEQRLLTAVLAGQHDSRYRWRELWELADLFGAGP